MEKCISTVRINGRDVECSNEIISINNLELDIKNPRIQSKLKGRTEISQQELENIIWDFEDTKRLMQSVLQNGGVQEPLLIKREAEKLVVIEGNSRLTVSRRLYRKYPEKENFKVVPVKIFDDSLKSEEVRNILASEHIAGKSPWPEYEQAQQIFNLHDLDGQTFEWIAKHIGQDEKYVENTVSAIFLTKEYLDIDPECTDIDNKFKIMAAPFRPVRKKKLIDKLNKDKSFKEEFFNWLKTDKITAKEQVSELLTILNNKEAHNALNNDGFDKAKQIIKSNNLGGSNNLIPYAKKILSLTETISRNAVKKLNEDDIKIITNLQKEINSIIRDYNNFISKNNLENNEILNETLVTV